MLFKKCMMLRRCLAMHAELLALHFLQLAGFEVRRPFDGLLKLHFDGPIRGKIGLGIHPDNAAFCPLSVEFATVASHFFGQVPEDARGFHPDQVALLKAGRFVELETRQNTGHLDLAGTRGSFLNRLQWNGSSG